MDKPPESIKKVDVWNFSACNKRNAEIIDLWLQCKTDREIEEWTNIKKSQVNNIIVQFFEEYQKVDKPPESIKKVDVWNFSACNKRNAEIIDLWLQCKTEREISIEANIEKTLIHRVIASFLVNLENEANPPESIKKVDVYSHRGSRGLGLG